MFPGLRFGAVVGFLEFSKGLTGVCIVFFKCFIGCFYEFEEALQGPIAFYSFFARDCREYNVQWGFHKPFEGSRKGYDSEGCRVPGILGFQCLRLGFRRFRV